MTPVFIQTSFLLDPHLHPPAADRPRQEVLPPRAQGRQARGQPPAGGGPADGAAEGHKDGPEEDGRTERGLHRR